MTALTLLLICIAAQVLIAGALGIYLLRRFIRKRNEGKTEHPPGEKSSGDKG